MLDLTGLKQSKGYLEAVEPRESVEGLGIMWLCRCTFGKCDDKGTRLVLARDFKSQRIKKCRKCVSPVFKAQQKRLCADKKKKEKSLGPPWYSEEFKRTWKRRLAEFGPLQRLLFDTIMDGRTNPYYRMQAVDLVLRSPDIKWELRYDFNIKRVRRNMGRALEMLDQQAQQPLKTLDQLRRAA